MAKAQREAPSEGNIKIVQVTKTRHNPFHPHQTGTEVHCTLLYMSVLVMRKHLFLILQFLLESDGSEKNYLPCVIRVSELLV